MTNPPFVTRTFKSAERSAGAAVCGATLEVQAADRRPRLSREASSTFPILPHPLQAHSPRDRDAPRVQRIVYSGNIREAVDALVDASIATEGSESRRISIVDVVSRSS